MNLNKNCNYFILLLIAISTSCCTTTRIKETPLLGKVESVNKIAEKDKTPGNGTKIGAVSGGGIGAAAGAVGGAMAGVGVSIVTFGLAAPIVPGMALSGAALGGATGAAIGGGVGYIHDYRKAGSGLYEYKIVTEHNENITIRQVDKTPLMIGQHVKITWEKNHRIITALEPK